MEQSYGFGVAGGLDPEIVRAIARQAENLGYTTFWANDTPNGDGLATLAVAASVTSTIRLGVGVFRSTGATPKTSLPASAISDCQLTA